MNHTLHYPLLPLFAFAVKGKNHLTWLVRKENVYDMTDKKHKKRRDTSFERDFRDWVAASNSSSFFNLCFSNVKARSGGSAPCVDLPRLIQ